MNQEIPADVVIKKLLSQVADLTYKNCLLEILVDQLKSENQEEIEVSD